MMPRKPGEEQLKNRQGLTEEEFLARYDPAKYARPSVTVDAVVFTVTDTPKTSARKLPGKELRVLLVRRGDHPFIQKWALPGGFIRMGEDLDRAVARELFEETGVDHIYMEQLYTFGGVNRDPRTRVISCAHMSLIDSAPVRLKAGEDAAEARWFTVKEKVVEEKRTVQNAGEIRAKRYELLFENGEEMFSAGVVVETTIENTVKKVHREVTYSDGLAFDHAMIIQYGLERLKNKIEYADIAFNLMPGLFTLTELQQVYEVILGRSLLMANFRRKVKPMVEETDLTKRYAGRPSKLYRFNPRWEDKAP